MIKKAALACVALSAFIGWAAFANGNAYLYPNGSPTSLYPKLVGEPYIDAKRKLLRPGAFPIHEKGKFVCLSGGPVCSLPEVFTCAADHPICVMGWKDAHKRIFTIQTSYDEKHGPSVRGLKVDWIWFGDPSE